MSKAELNAYYHHLDNVVILRDNIVTARGEGHLEGHAEGLEEGRAEGRVEGRAEGRAEGREEGINIGTEQTKIGIAKQMKRDGVPVPTIMKYTGLTDEEIGKL